MTANSLPSFKCANCSSDGHTNEHGQIEIWSDEFCERGFCSEQCFQLHSCAGHEAELALCIGCGKEIPLVPNLFGIDEDPECSDCKLEKVKEAV
jgi:hypothetical protein